MTGPAVYLAVRRTEATLCSAVTVAGQALGIRVTPWAGEPTVPTMPSLVISGLAAGERRIPAELVGLLTEAAPDATLLILSGEPLVEPVVRLSGGRVVMIGAPLSAERIQQAMHAALARDATPPEPISHQRLSPRWWVAQLSTVRGAGPDGQPPLHETQVDGVTALLGQAPHLHGALREVAAIVSSAGSAEAKAEALDDVLDGETNVVHLSATGDTWTFYWPAATALWLLSPMRLPAKWDLGAALRRVPRVRLLTVPARADDLIVAMTAPAPADEVMPPSADGPVVLAWLTERWTGRAQALSALIAMVRR